MRLGTEKDLLNASAAPLRLQDDAHVKVRLHRMQTRFVVLAMRMQCAADNDVKRQGSVRASPEEKNR